MTGTPPSDTAAPFVVELDADLLRGNLRGERFWCALRSDWRAILPGNPAREVAAREFDIAHLPYDDTVLHSVRAARAAGRTTVLRAADPALAEAVAAELGCFDTTEAGPPMRATPASRTRPRLPVFAEALRAMRPHQWVKNLLVFLPMVVGHRVDLPSLGQSLLAFLSFSLIASAVYLLNDLMDLPADRRHRTKRERPFASGRLPLSLGGRLVPALLAAGFLIAALNGPALLGVMAVYAVTTTAYSFRIKGSLGADIIVLATLYTLRIIAGSAATATVPSMWLLSFSIFLFLSLGAVKRLAELVDLESQDVRKKAEGRAYQIEDRPVVAMIATSAGFLAVLVLALYIDTSEVQSQYNAPQFLWGIGLVLLYWISRTVLLAHRGLVNQDPVIFALTDRISRWTALVAIVLYIAAAMG
ncbi:UbiA family prenyltransferase [Sinisalibacter aestuarii]|uniref:Prenyltransferase n=1 Tax=Sinisalibacter aestuarii TaxID=2949426 RepID=A0ABQ5LQN0_9RHOB|nr:UbiA family prenyltransferase [Sinisalibacter aestuarii]GKY87317.1 prenyltransferase [Sinisalibacter aestuarii]